MTGGTVGAITDEAVLQPRGKDRMRHDRTITKIAGRAATATVALLLLAAQLPAWAQGAPLDETALHPAPVALQQPPAAIGAPADCQPATLVARLQKHVMPDVTGCPLYVVERSFMQAHLGPANVEPQANDSSSVVVRGSDPAAGKPLLPDKQVTLFVATGPVPPPPPPSTAAPTATAAVGHEPKQPAMTTVPPVRGYAVASAVGAINDSHLRPIPGSREYSDVLRGRISHTDPPANAPVREGSSVKYWISLGQKPTPWPPPAASVPSVIGKTPAEATAILRQAGLTAGEPIAEFSFAGTGRISRQEPSAGSPPSSDRMVLVWWPYAWLSMLGLVVIPLLILGSAAGLWRKHVVDKRRLAHTRAVLHIHPSLALDGETRLVGASPPIGPTVVLRASLQPGELRFVEPVSIERQEIQHD